MVVCCLLILLESVDTALGMLLVFFVTLGGCESNLWLGELGLEEVESCVWDMHDT